MANDSLFNYGQWLNEGFLHVLKKSLETISSYGIDNQHSLYISFYTCYDGVQLSDRMKERYPEDITIVIENEFWNLSVYESYFEVDLSFSNIQERVQIPYGAIISFSDPAGQVGFEFIVDEDEEIFAEESLSELLSQELSHEDESSDEKSADEKSSDEKSADAKSIKLEKKKKTKVINLND